MFSQNYIYVLILVFYYNISSLAADKKKVNLCKNTH